MTESPYDELKEEIAGTHTRLDELNERGSALRDEMIRQLAGQDARLGALRRELTEEIHQLRRDLDDSLNPPPAPREWDHFWVRSRDGGRCSKCQSIFSNLATKTRCQIRDNAEHIRARRAGQGEPPWDDQATHLRALVESDISSHKLEVQYDLSMGSWKAFLKAPGSPTVGYGANPLEAIGAWYWHSHGGQRYTKHALESMKDKHPQHCASESR